MQFELTEALIDDILFAMEDQEGEFYLDTVEGIVVGGLDWPDDLKFQFNDDAKKGGGRFISLPEWDSADGFRLMERFAAGFRNPMVREELSSALSLGRGVFRAFKNVLGRYPETEKLWFSYKEKEMKREIIRWYNGLREEWGLERIGSEPEETSDLLHEDFCFRPFQKDDKAQIEALHRCCLEEAAESLKETSAGLFTESIINEIYSFQCYSGPFSGIVAESSEGEFAGYISGIIKDSALYVQNLEVKAPFRGLGVGEALIEKFLEGKEDDQINQVFLDIPFWAESFSRVLLRRSFKPYMVRYHLKLNEG